MNELRAKQNGTQSTRDAKKTRSTGGNTAEVPLLPEGNPNPSPLIPPQPRLHEPAKKRAESKPRSDNQDRRAHPSSVPPTLPEVEITDVGDIAELKKLMD